MHKDDNAFQDLNNYQKFDCLEVPTMIVFLGFSYNEVLDLVSTHCVTPMYK